MREAPFSVTMFLFVLYLIAFVLGCLIAWVLGLVGVTGWIGLALTGFISFILVGILRPKIGGFFAHAEGVEGSAPYAFTASIRYIIGAVVSVILAFLLTLNGGGLGFNMVTGGLISLLTTMIVGLIFMFNIASRD